MNAQQPYLTLNNGVRMPQFGLGLYMIPEGEEAYNSVKTALESGYRHFDCAHAYQNERSLGRAIKEAQERYYLERGKYAYKLLDLDIGLPDFCTVVNAGGGNMWYCGDEWFLNNSASNNKSDGLLDVRFCPGSSKTNYLDCRENRDAEIKYYYNYPSQKSFQQYAGKILCSGSTPKGQKICRLFCGGDVCWID